ncbi:hypothetical protein [Variovorax sp. DT-64]|uniref:hypothetical protein n=1 Tax=Variovorax sp. DT-64 TaxID=3396160 RepID=UPI003F53F169
MNSIPSCQAARPDLAVDRAANDRFPAIMTSAGELQLSPSCPVLVVARRDQPVSAGGIDNGLPRCKLHRAHVGSRAMRTNRQLLDCLATAMAGQGVGAAQLQPSDLELTTIYCAGVAELAFHASRAFAATGKRNWCSPKRLGAS